MSKNHLQRYVSQFAEKHNIRELDTGTQVQYVPAALVRQRLVYENLIAQGKQRHRNNSAYAL